MNLRREIGLNSGASWIDVTGPTKEDLEKLSSEFNIDQSMALACMDPEHLPKFEKLEAGGEFFILRIYDENSSRDADTTQELTRKIVVFRKTNVIITIHRSPLKLIDTLSIKWQSRKISEKEIAAISFDLFLAGLNSFDKPVDMALDQLEALEMSIFGAEGAEPFELKQGYLLKRKSFVFKRLLHSMIEIVDQVEMLNKSQRQKLKDQYQNIFYYCDELAESTNSLLGLHISLSSQTTNQAAQETNEVVRVLTIFSMFLLPLNVVTGIYGMNFEFMPELRSPYGYPVALLSMVAITLFIYLWFRRKGWLR